MYHKGFGLVAVICLSSSLAACKGSSADAPTIEGMTPGVSFSTFKSTLDAKGFTAGSTGSLNWIANSVTFEKSDGNKTVSVKGIWQKNEGALQDNTKFFAVVEDIRYTAPNPADKPKVADLFDGDLKQFGSKFTCQKKQATTLAGIFFYDAQHNLAPQGTLPCDKIMEGRGAEVIGFHDKYPYIVISYIDTFYQNGNEHADELVIGYVKTADLKYLPPQ